MHCHTGEIIVSIINMFASDYRTVELPVELPSNPSSTADTAAEPADSTHQSAPHRTLMLGCGAMGSALLTRWTLGPSHEVLIARRRHRPLAVEGVATLEQPLQVPEQSLDYLIIAVKPQQISSAVAPWISRLKADGVLVSIAAGVSAASLEQLTGVKRIVRLMPNLAVRVGRGICGMYSTQSVTKQQKAGIERLLQHTGEVVTVGEEADLDRITAVAGSGTGFVLEVASHYAESIRRLGFDSQSAERLAVETLLGAAMLASESDVSPEQLRDQVTSAGGTTASGLKALREATRLDLAFDQTFQAALKRAIELR